MKTKLITDRRLWLTTDRDQVVEDGDPEAAYLLVACAGRTIPADVVVAAGIQVVDGRIAYPGSPDFEEAEEAEAEAGEVEADNDDGKTLRFGKGAQAEDEPEDEILAAVADEEGAAEELEDDSDDSDRNDEPELVWPGRSTPEAYLERYPTGPKAELAKRIIAANAGADGGS